MHGLTGLTLRGGILKNSFTEMHQKVYPTVKPVKPVKPVKLEIEGRRKDRC